MTELWRPIPSLAGYEASSAGRIRNCRGRVLQGAIDRYGYVYFRLKDGQKRKAHRLVCEAFHGPPTAEQCAHGNGEKLDNRPENLRWASRSENARDSIRHGTFRHPPGGNRPAPGSRKGIRTNPKLTLRQVGEIRTRCAAGEQQKLIAREYGVAPSTVCRIVSFQRGLRPFG